MDKKLIVVIGGAVLIVGLFLPIMSGGGQSGGFLSGGIEWSGAVLILCGGGAAALGFMNLAKHAVWLGVAALGILVLRFMQTRELISNLSGLLPDTANLPPEYAAQVAAAQPAVNYLGWGVLGLGAVLIIVGGAMAWKSNPPAA